ncbi:MAG: DUF2269 family protein [Gammaproteobacteria bacterium]|nr:DUF2269 family protein [Gammaproteobacteria bacterium]MDX2462401.1 DUF2269 family protein [Gammaproteobacteria bacterium]
MHILSATILFGTGLGIAYFMLRGHLSGNRQAMAVVVRSVVMADWVFTAPAVVRLVGARMQSPRSRCGAPRNNKSCSKTRHDPSAKRYVRSSVEELVTVGVQCFLNRSGATEICRWGLTRSDGHPLGSHARKGRCHR